MIQLTNLYGDNSIFINVNAIASFSSILGESGTLINTIGGNTYSVKEDAPTINSMIIAARRG